MLVTITHQTKKFEADLAQPLSIGLPLKQGGGNPTCYYAEPVRVETIVAGSFVGSVKLGGSVNYQKITLTPHGNGTHTECYGHLSADDAAIHAVLNRFHHLAEVVTLQPRAIGEDRVVELSALEAARRFPGSAAIVLRTTPNDESKRTRDYSGTNPPYLEPELAGYLCRTGVEHLLVDLPSVDREVDGGALLAHRAFWNTQQALRKHCTITELIFVPDSVPDGLYLLNLQVAPFELDAAPSNPVLFKLKEVII